MFYKSIMVYRRLGNQVHPIRVQSAHSFGGATVASVIRGTPTSQLFAGHCDWIDQDIRAREAAYNAKRAA